MSETLQRILEEVNTLSELERRQLIAALRRARGSSAAPTEHAFEAKLAAEGWLSLPEAAPSGSPPFQLTSPLAVRGRPCSEILTEDRR